MGAELNKVNAPFKATKERSDAEVEAARKELYQRGWHENKILKSVQVIFFKDDGRRVNLRIEQKDFKKLETMSHLNFLTKKAFPKTSLTRKTFGSSSSYNNGITSEKYSTENSLTDHKDGNGLFPISVAKDAKPVLD